MDGDRSGVSVVAGRVKWFDANKGFGFIVSDTEGADILLHVNVLRAFGQATVADGAEIVVATQKTARGVQATEIMSIEVASEVTAENAAGIYDEIASADPSGPVEPARVKWFDRVKGFGFANVFGSSQDVFLHAEVLRRAGLTDLQPGEAISIRVADGRRGKLAAEVRPWECNS